MEINYLKWSNRTEFDLVTASFGADEITLPTNDN